jgi:hypothetical protein
MACKKNAARQEYAEREHGQNGSKPALAATSCKEHSMSFSSFLKPLPLLSAALLLQACGNFAPKEETSAQPEEILTVIPEIDPAAPAIEVLDRGYGYINRRGEIVIPPRFDIAWEFAANGLARVEVDGKIGYINTKGEEVISPRFGFAGDFADNGLAAVEEDGKWGYINAQGEEVIPLRFDFARAFTANGLAAVEANGKWGYINTQGEEVIPLRFDDAGDFGDNDLAWIRENGKAGYLDRYGQVVR